MGAMRLAALSSGAVRAFPEAVEGFTQAAGGRDFRPGAEVFFGKRLACGVNPMLGGIHMRLLRVDLSRAA